ncbi:MAG: phosphate transport regulator [Hylemonella sp.]|nr:phosphate transport regulator [Hylemonella sp.]
MLKEKAVSSLGQSTLLLPAWIKSALSANDRLKLYLTLLQSAAQHADAPDASMIDWGQELAQAGLHDAAWLRELVKTSYLDGNVLVIPQLDPLLDALASDLTIMARPVCDSGHRAPEDLVVRRDQWLQRLHGMEGDEGLNREVIVQLTHGDRQQGDSFHLLVMDLHKQLNALAAEIATENLDGAHVWQISDADRPFIQSFMRGLNRTASLKFSHPGLDTAVTRDGEKLLIQNDIGTNDAHVLVLEVEGTTLTVTYSDLHAARFAFFCHALERIGFQWKLFDPVTSTGLNGGKPYHVGKGTLVAEDEEMLHAGLQGIASRIVFVIDWNRARKCLKNFVSKSQAVEILVRAAEKEWGHMAWLLAGGDQLVFNAMQTVDSEVFRIGDRLDGVIGEAAATEFLLDLLRISSHMLLLQQPAAVIADEARLLLTQVLRRRTFEFDLLAEHAAYCHALAQTLSDAIETSARPPVDGTDPLVSRAKTWERRADHVLMDARQRAVRQRHWSAVVALLEKADDVADALEEAAFMHSMTVIPPMRGLPAPVRHVLQQLAETTQAAIQDLVKAIEIARHVNEHGDAADSEAFLQTLWRMLQAERMCDDLLRQARVTILQTLHAQPTDLLLANDLAKTLEQASDSLLETGYALRQMVLTNTGVST